MKLRNLSVILCLLLSMASFYSGQVIAQDMPIPALCKIECNQSGCGIASFTIDNKSCDQRLTYRSQNAAIATIDSQTGKIQSLKDGHTMIYASLESTKKCKAAAAACALKVIDASLTVQTATRDYGESPFVIPYLHGSNELVVFTSTDPKIITIDGKTATITGVGNAWITVRDKSGFSEAQLRVTVNPPDVLHPVYLPEARYSEFYDTSLTAEWGYAPYTYTLVENSRLPTGLMLTNGVLTGTPIAIGNYTFTVRVTDKNGISTDQEYVLAISPIQPTFTVPEEIIKTVDDMPFSVPILTNNSAGAFSYTSSKSEVASVSGNQVTINGVGATTITVKQAADGNYSASKKTFKVTVNKAPQILSFDANTSKICTYGQPCQVKATSSSKSGLPISYSVDESTEGTCGVDSKGKVTYNKAGDCTINAIQEGNHNYHSGMASRTITMKKATVQIQLQCNQDKILATFTPPGSQPLSLKHLSIQYGAHDSKKWNYTVSHITVSSLSGSKVQATAQRVDQKVDYLAAYDHAADDYYEKGHKAIECKHK